MQFEIENLPLPIVHSDFCFTVADVNKLRKLREQEQALRDRCIIENEQPEPEELCDGFYTERSLYRR